MLSQAAPMLFEPHASGFVASTAFAPRLQQPLESAQFREHALSFMAVEVANQLGSGSLARPGEGLAASLDLSALRPFLDHLVVELSSQLSEMPRIYTASGSETHVFRPFFLLRDLEAYARATSADLLSAPEASPSDPVSDQVAQRTPEFRAAAAISSTTTLTPPPTPAPSTAGIALSLTRGIDDATSRQRSPGSAGQAALSPRTLGPERNVFSEGNASLEQTRTRLARESGESVPLEAPDQAKEVDPYRDQKARIPGDAAPVLAGLVDVGKADLTMLEQGLQNLAGDIGSVGKDLAHQMTDQAWWTYVLGIVAAGVTALEAARRTRQRTSSVLLDEATHSLAFTWLMPGERE